jgi:hypothetical protein
MEKITSGLISPVIKDVYSDAVAPAMREFGKIGEDAVKVVHLALFPIQYGALLQERLARYLAKALDKVPEERRVAPRDAVMLPVAEKLRHQDEDGNPIADLYVNLLARAMDRDRLGDAHPAFVHLIGQLAPDEILILLQLNAQRHRVFFRHGPREPALLHEQVPPLLQRMPFPVATELLGAAVRPEDLAQPELFLTFLEHLVALGIVEYTHEPRSEETEKMSFLFLGFEYHFIRLTAFGHLFHRACVAS